MSKQNIVVVGGGGAGAAIARSLSGTLDSSKYNLILVNSREYAIHYPATLRMLVTDEGRLEDQILAPYDALFAKGNGSVKVGVVTGIEKNSGEKGGSVILESGERIPYTLLVLAPGSLWVGVLNFPNDKEETIAFIQTWRQKFHDAKEIAIVGGGAVGIELAGELRDIYETKKITIVHAGRLLVNDTYPDRFRTDMGKRMRARNIDIILNDRIDQMPSEGSTGVQTSKGTIINADLVVMTPGGKPNTALFRSLGEGVLDDSARVKVLPTLQLKSHPDIFAAGDVTDVAEVKQVAKYGGHTSVITANIMSLLAGNPAQKEYKSMKEVILITNGKRGGAAYLPILWGLVLGDWFSSMLKSKSLFVSMYRKGLGLS